MAVMNPLGPSGDAGKLGEETNMIIQRDLVEPLKASAWSPNVVRSAVSCEPWR